MHDRRKEITEPPLNADSFVSVVAIGRPHPASLFKNAKIYSRSTGCAGLDLYKWVSFAKPAENFV